MKEQPAKRMRPIRELIAELNDHPLEHKYKNISLGLDGALLNGRGMAWGREWEGEGEAPHRAYLVYTKQGLISILCVQPSALRMVF